MANQFYTCVKAMYFLNRIVFAYGLAAILNHSADSQAWRYSARAVYIIGPLRGVFSASFRRVNYAIDEGVPPSELLTTRVPENDDIYLPAH